MASLSCLADHELNSFLAGDAPTGRREEIEFHLSRCHHCRQRLVRMYHSLRTQAVTARAPWWLKAIARRIPKTPSVALPRLVFRFRHQLAGGLAAALLVTAGALFIITSQEWRQRPPSDVWRQEEPMSGAIRLLAPAEWPMISSQAVEFHWSSVPDAQSYTLTLLNEKGDIVFQASTAKERLTRTAAEMGLERGISYFWYVMAKLSDGTSVESEIRKLTLN